MVPINKETITDMTKYRTISLISLNKFYIKTTIKNTLQLFYTILLVKHKVNYGSVW